MEQTIEIEFNKKVDLEKWTKFERDLWIMGGSQSHKIWDILRRQLIRLNEGGLSMILSKEEAMMLFSSSDWLCIAPNQSIDVKQYRDDLDEALCKYDNVFLIDIEKGEIVERYCAENPKEFAFAKAMEHYSPSQGRPSYTFRPTENFPDRYIIRLPEGNPHIIHYFYTIEQQKADNEKSISNKQEKAS